MVLERLAGELEPDRVVDLIEAGAEPLRDFIAALHSKLLVEELKRQRESRRLALVPPDRRAPPSRRSPRPAPAPPGSSPEKVPNGWR